MKRFFKWFFGGLALVLIVWVALNFWPYKTDELWTDTELKDIKLPFSVTLSFSDKSENDRESIRAQASRGESEFAYERLAERLRYDISWYHIATGLIDTNFAILAVRKDLELFEELQKQYAPPDRGFIKRTVRNMDPSSWNLQKALVAEYRVNLADAETLLNEARAHWANKIIFRPALTYRELNAYFSDYEQFLENPNTGAPRLKRGPLWWFVNPGGKLINNLILIDWSDSIRGFNETKSEIQQLRQNLLFPKLKK